MKYYNIALNMNLDKLFTYGSDIELSLNRRCIVPFGSGARTGIIVEEVTDSIPNYEVKPIIEVLDDSSILQDDLWKLSFWMSSYYQCSLGKVMFSMLPKGISVEIQSEFRMKDEERLRNEESELYSLIGNGEWHKVNETKAKHLFINYKKLENWESSGLIEIKRVYDQRVKIKVENYIFLNDDKLVVDKKLSKRALELYTYLKSREEIVSLREIAKDFSYHLVRTLKEKDLIKVIALEVHDNINLMPQRSKRKEVDLTDEQRVVIESIKSNLGMYGVDLLYGITGSGKTEVYIRIMEEVLSCGKNALLLVPEISLTPQAVDRFYSAFGENIAILHSHLSDRERLYEWNRIRNSESRIIIGARSAIFAPLSNIGLIVVDEEHEGSYKQDNNPRYNARDLAVIRGKINSCQVILGSATPSLESWYNAKSKKYNLYKMLKRPAGIVLPKVYVVDMRKERNKTLLSDELLEAISDRLERKEQVILFQNRRGYATFLQCKSCGEIIKCPHCDISMHYHSYNEEMRCHYCGYSKPVPRKCPVCGKYSYTYGAGGTQKLEDQVRAFFPSARVLRMDSDTATKKNSYDEMFELMNNQEIDILIGTQMISKGLDFPNVTLVGVILADITLNLPDFRASERTFQLLTQVAGRAGRGEKIGNVYIQTYMPEHYAIIRSSEQDFVSMAETELKLRESLSYPPHFRLARIVFTGSDRDKIKRLFDKNRLFFNQLSSLFTLEELRVLGPATCPIEKVRNRYRYHLIFKGSNVSIISSVLKFFKLKFHVDRSVKVDIDVDCSSLL